MKLNLTRVTRGYLQRAIEAGPMATEMDMSCREVLLARMDALPHYTLGETYFDAKGLTRMPLKVEGDVVWFVAPDVGKKGEKRLQICRLPKHAFNDWAAETKMVSYLSIGEGLPKPAMWEGL
jgi:hypothetical protein